MGSSGSCEMNSVKSNGRKHEEMALIQIDGSKTEDWIKKIKKKECTHFVSRTDREEVCHCGKAKREHKLENNDPTEPEWIPEKHIIEMPTDAFGDLTFKGFGNKTAKYVRASDSTPPEVLYEMMRTQWQLKAPNLLITVTGGASYFHMPPRLKKLFSQGLVEAARSTGAWIFTGGCHAGVAKLVGEAMPDFSQSGRGHHEIVTIGIAPWGTIYNRDGLIKKEWGCPDEYNLVVTNQDCLDQNHSHFILVDDGTQGRYGVEIPLRTKLEQVIPELTMKEGVDMKIPIVCVVLAGNLNTLDIVHSYVTNYTPCVIVEGSKGFADVIAQVADMDPSKITFNLIKEKLQFTLQVNGSPEKILECTKKIEDIVRMRQLLTIFRADKGSTQGMDFTMALLKASQSMDSKNLVYQLYLAVLWNRLDIAKNEIFNGKGSLKPKDLYPALTVALIENRTDFVQLLLKQGVRLRDYVSPETLKYLYDNIKSDTLFCQKLEKIKKDLHENLEVFTLHHIEKALKSLCNFTGSLNFTTEPQTPVTSQSTPFTDCQAPQKMDYPIQDLLIWAVVQNRGELAKILWTECQDWIAGALTCRKILRALYKEETDTNNADKIKALADRFEERATGVFSECYREDEGRAEQLLTRCSPDWGYTTCLQLAWNDEKSFMINSGVQKIMSKIWWGELSENNSLFRLLICMVFFPLIYTDFITFRQESGTLSPPQRLRAFVTAPVVIFYFNVVSYIGFLWLFAYVLMMDFQDTPSWTEYLLYVWVFSLFCEEVRQLNYYHGKVTFMTRSSIYITDFWNLMDVMAIILFLVGQVCRRITVSLYAGRVILAVDFIIFCLRLMHLFIVNKFLGPKIIMMKGMIMDIASFLFLLTVWVVSFGVSKQVILVHNEERLDWIFRSVIYQPFLTLFGQLPTDMDKLNFDNSTCTADGSDATLPKCVETLDGVPLFPEWLTIILLCLYLLFAGLLLINLLIAMFSHTFSEVQSNTDMLWKVHQYKLINEYRKRPSLPPPFNLLRILGTLVKKVNCKKQDQGHEGQQRNGSSVFFWEEEMKSKYLLQQQESQDQRSDLEIKDISKKVDALTKSLESEQKRASMMEQQVSQSLDWIMKSLTEKGLASEEKAPVMEHLKSIEAEKPTTGDKTKYYKKSEYHVHSRQLMYPGSNVQRFPVPHELVPWKVDFDCYFPPSYIAEKEGRETHNPWMEAAGSQPKNEYPVGEDHPPAAGSQPKNEYPVGEDHPPNPEGRTGIKGLGSLMWYGPNHSLHLVLTRWKSDEYKLFVWKGGKKVLEVLAVKREGSERWGLPGGRLRPDEKLPSTLKAILKEESWEMFEALLEKRTEGRLRPDEKLLSTLKAILKEESWKMFEALLEKRTEVHNGYQDDPRNTDDAWVVLRAVSAHLESPEDLTFLESNLCTLESADSICWLMVDEKMPLYANMKDILREVARKLNAHY